MTGSEHVRSEPARLVQAGRSFLFVPGDRPDRFDKAVASRADMVILDLEDAVASERRAEARASVSAWLAGGGRAAVRINRVGSPDHGPDVTSLVETAPLAVVVAKAEDPQALSALADRVSVPVLALLETAGGVQQAAAIAAAPGVARLAFGHLDYAVDLGVEPTRTAMLHARSTMVLASRAAGLPGPIDGVTTDLDDTATLMDDLSHARQLGLTGKLLIHPRQVQATHAAYRPSQEEVAWAERVLAAARDGAVVRVNGAMVDRPVVARAEEMLHRRDP